MARIIMRYEPRALVDGGQGTGIQEMHCRHHEGFFLICRQLPQSRINFPVTKSLAMLWEWLMWILD